MRETSNQFRYTELFAMPWASVSLKRTASSVEKRYPSTGRELSQSRSCRSKRHEGGAMGKLVTIVLLALALAVAAGCTSGGGDRSEEGGSAEPSALKDSAARTGAGGGGELAVADPRPSTMPPVVPPV